MFMLIALFVQFLKARINISEILNKPISIKSIEGYEQYLDYGSKKNTLRFSRRKGKLSLTTNFILKKNERGYEIWSGNKFITVDPDLNIILETGYDFISYLDIIDSVNGFKILYKGMCLTKFEHKSAGFRNCISNDSGNSNSQVFEFLPKRNSFFGNFEDIFCNNGSDLSDDISMGDIDLEKKFKDSVYDKPFVESMRYFYDFAEKENIQKIEERMHHCANSNDNHNFNCKK